MSGQIFWILGFGYMRGYHDANIQWIVTPGASWRDDIKREFAQEGKPLNVL